MVSPQRSARRAVDAAALAHHLRRLQRAPAPPWLHGEAARRMAERLPLVRLKPDRIVEWNVFAGAGHELLVDAYPRARILGVEPDAQRRDASRTRWQRPWWSHRRWRSEPFEVVLPDEVPGGEAGLVWANMVLQGEIDPQAAMCRWHHALQVEGFVMFATLGPGSLIELASLYAAQGWPEPFAPFVDMHDLGDMLIEAGFSDPVMDQEQLTLTWPCGDSALAELRGLGGNAALQRMAGLRTPRWRDRLARLLEARSGDGRSVALSFELVYGHAFRAAPRPRATGRTEVPLQDMRALAQRRPGRA